MSWEALVEWLNRWNDAWLEGARRLSPRLLQELPATTGDAVFQYFSSLDPYEIDGAVSWAGPDPAPVWLDIAGSIRSVGCTSSRFVMPWLTPA